MSPGIGSLNRALLFQSFRARRWGTLGKEGRAASAPTESSNGTSAHAASEAYRASPKIERFQGEAENIRTSTETGYPAGVPGGQRHVSALWRSSPIPAFPTATFPRSATGLARGVG